MTNPDDTGGKDNNWDTLRRDNLSELSYFTNNPTCHQLLTSSNSRTEPSSPPFEEFQVVFRSYPFPPTKTPLSYPLHTSKNCLSIGCALRKRILRRWKSDVSEVESTRRQFNQRKRTNISSFAEPARHPRLVVPQRADGYTLLPSCTARKRIKRAESSHDAEKRCSERLKLLQRRRFMLEEMAREEIGAVARALADKVTQEDRLQLKVDMERLTEQGARDCLGLVMRRLNLREKSRQVKLHLNVIPEGLVKELQLMVMQDHGQLQSDVGKELGCVREELRRVATEQRRQSSIV